jgi:hypothetical protein
VSGALSTRKENERRTLTAASPSTSAMLLISFDMARVTRPEEGEFGFSDRFVLRNHALLSNAFD